MLSYSDQYAKKETGDLPSFKALCLQDLIAPANQGDEKTLSKTAPVTVEEVDKPCRGLVAEPYPLSEPRTHIPAYMELSGAQVGLPGVGEGENWGKIPIDWDAGTVIHMAGWAKIIQAPVGEEPCKVGRHIEMMDPVSWRPKQVTYHSKNGSSVRAVAQDTAKICNADWITLSNYRIPIGCPDLVDKDVVDLDEVVTPRTPPMRD